MNGEDNIPREEGRVVPLARHGIQHDDSPLVHKILRFARHARDNGFPMGIEEALDALEFAGQSDLLDRESLRWGLRTLFCSSPDDWERFDNLFDSYWSYGGERTILKVSGSLPRPGGEGTIPTADQLGFGNELAEADETAGGATARERLEGTDFRHLDSERDLQAVHDLAERLARRMRWRLSRRRRVRARGRTIDLRNTIHKSLRHGGTPLELAYRRRHPRPLKLVVILDASGSMNLYSTFFIRFIRGIIESFAQSDAFVFHTRLVHLSSALREKDIERAVERMAVMSAGWGGGTRIGESLKTFNRHHAKSVINSRTVVMIVSDGYDTGPPDVLAAQVKKLRGRARRVVWLNPMIGWKGYEPVAQGMTAALPHVDLFAPAHNLESLAKLAPYLERL
ncbi:MAG: VWA domain-containing protein [Alphaproteobacteria bacterium]|nr:VWA domain-containing protein [Alphaproteobacteria bacterium]